MSRRSSARSTPAPHLNRIGRVRVTFELEVALDHGFDSSFEEDPSDADWDDDLNAIRGDVENHFKIYGLVEGLQVEVLKAPQKLSEVKNA